jgi:FkbM family methyltransferase
MRFRQWLVRLLHGTKQLWRVNLSVPTQIAGQVVRIPILLGNGLQNLDIDSSSEPWLMESLRRLFARRAGAFVDVGVNIGQTLIKAKALDRRRPYYGFEPNPGCCHYVEQLIHVNQFPNCTMIPTGLSDCSGIATLRSHPHVSLDSCASLVDGFAFGYEGLDAGQVATLLPGDEVMARLEIDEIAVIKIDVEGGELEVLRGLERTLRARRPYVICEILPVVDVKAPTGELRLTRQEAVLDFLRKMGYAAFRVHGDLSIQPIEAIEVHSSLDLSNYIFVPAGEVDVFLCDFGETGNASIE